MRINVGVKTVFVRRCQISGGWRTLAGVNNTTIDLIAKAIFPRAQSVAPARHFCGGNAINTHGHQCERMHCFVETQSFDIRIFQPAADKAVHNITASAPVHKLFRKRHTSHCWWVRQAPAICAAENQSTAPPSTTLPRSAYDKYALPAGSDGLNHRDRGSMVLLLRR